MAKAWVCEYCGLKNPSPELAESDPLSLFREAENIINGDRRRDYGDAKEFFERIATLWTAYLDFPVSPADVAAMMALLKLVRLKYSGFTHHDSFVDMLGYVGLAHKVAGEK